MATRIYSIIETAGAAARIARSTDVNSPLDLTNAQNLGVSTQPIKGTARVRIKDSDIQKAVVCAGPGIMQYTADGGDTWPYPTSGVTDVNLVDISWFDINWAADGSDTVYACGLNELSGLTIIVKSTNGGATWADVPNPSVGTFFQATAIFPLSDNECYLVNGDNYSEILYTNNSGVSWTSLNENTPHPAFTSNTGNENFDDIWASLDKNHVYVSSNVSNSVWMTANATDPSPTWVKVFNGSTFGGGLGFNLSRMQVIPNGSTTENVYLIGETPQFRLIQTDARNAPTGWGSALYSLDSTIDSAYFAREPEDFGVDASEEHFAIVVPSVAFGSEKGGAYYTDNYLIPNDLDVWNLYAKLEDDGPSPVAIDILVEPPVPGCTDPRACNQDLDADVDDGSCTYAVKLTDCENPGTTLDTGSLDIVELACYQPRGYVWFDLTEATAGSDLHQIGVTVYDENGVLLFQTNSGYTSQSGVDLNGAIDLLLAYINNIIVGFSARRVTPLNNPIAPGQLGGIVIISDDVTIGADATINVTYNKPLFNAPAITDGIATQSFDQGYPGFIIKVGEYPNQCWRVCGDGDCGLAVDLTLTSQFVDCYRCLPVRPTQTCIECNTYVSVGSTQIISGEINTHENCGNAGENVDISFNIGFPDYESETFVPVEAGSPCGANCPLELTFVGNVFDAFPLDTTITVNSDAPDAIDYTIAGVSYDSNADTTTVVTEEDCTNTGNIVDVLNYVNCPCNVVVTIDNLTTATSYLNQQYNCVDGFVNQTISTEILAAGEIYITITVNSCDGQTVCKYWLDTCTEYTVSKKDCHIITLTDEAYASPRVNTVAIENTAGDYTASYTFTSTIDITFPQDDVYILTVTNDQNVNTEIFEVFDLCDLRACKRKLILGIFCNEDDPCCNDCGDADLELRKQKRYEMNKISMLFSSLEVSLFKYQQDYLGVFGWDADRDLQVREIAGLFEKLRDLTDRCGECNNASTVDNGTPCVDCE